MLKLLGLLAFVFSAQAFAGTHLQLGFGASIPIASMDAAFVDRMGPSRINNGEHFVLRFRGEKRITSIRLTAHSYNKSGQVLVRDARARIANGGKMNEVFLVDLFQYNKALNNDCMAYQNLCL